MRAGGCTLQVRQDRQHLYIPAQLASTNRRWYTSWFYLRNNDGGLPPYTGRIVENYLEKWRYGIPKEDQPKLQPLLEGLQRLRDHHLTTAMVVAAFHSRRVLPLMARRRRLLEMRPDDSIVGIRLSASALSDEEILHRVRETVEVSKLRSGGLTTLAMRPSWGFLSLVSHAPLQSPSPLCFSLFLVPLSAFAVPVGDEGCASLPAAHS